MASYDEPLLVRLHEYANRRKLVLHEHLGDGIQGTVYSTTLPSAIKVFRSEEHYWREVAVYRRIKERCITSVCGFAVPKPLAHHDELLVLHMEIVRPPFVVDFASAGLDGPLFEHSEETLADWTASREELFEHRWPVVRQIISEFKAHGIFLSDVKPGNIMFAD